MRCPFCHESNDSVVDTRVIHDQTVIRRRRECNNCHKRFTTYERIEAVPVTVLKRENRLEEYDRGKAKSGLVKSLQKRHVTPESVNAVLDDLEKMIEDKSMKQITSREIGEFIMNRLKNLDQVAYVRFASVYKDFKTVDEFMGELSKLLDRKSD